MRYPVDGIGPLGSWDLRGDEIKARLQRRPALRTRQTLAAKRDLAITGCGIAMSAGAVAASRSTPAAPRRIDGERVTEGYQVSGQVWQLSSRETKLDRARLARFTVDESVCVQRLDHLVYYRRRHAEEPPKICFGRWRAVNLRVVVNEREILALLGCERSRAIE